MPACNRMFAAARNVLLVFAIALAWPADHAPAATAKNPLPSWKSGAARTALTSFVARVTKKGGPDFVPAAERIAVFDNDGTLWCEMPFYFQALYLMDRVKSMSPDHPEWKDNSAVQAILSGDMKALGAVDHKLLFELLGQTAEGQTTDEFAANVRTWVTTAKHPRFDRPFSECVYQPQLELLSYLRANGFKTFIVSGGVVDFMRPWATDVYGIPPEQIVGTEIGTSYDATGATPKLVRHAKIDFVDDGPGKPVGIYRSIGRRPILAFGNSDGDFQMLEYTTTGPGARLGLFVHHDDAGREYAYDRGSPVGKLERGLDEAEKRGWIVVSMKNDWGTIFPAAKPAAAAQAKSVKGTLTYLQKIALVAEAEIRVAIEDVSRADAPAVTLAETTFVAGGKQVPIAFELSYDPARVEPNHTYSMRATIKRDDKLWWVSDTATPVITRGAPSTVAIRLKLVEN